MIEELSEGVLETEERLSFLELAAHRRGLVFGTFLYDMEESNFRMSPAKTNELLTVVSDIVLKPESLRRLSNSRYNEVFMGAAKEAVALLRDQRTEEEIENREKFYERMKVFGKLDQLRIRIAYDLAKYSHRGIVREDKGRYFEHVRNTALILFDEAGVRDPNMIIAALLHDVVEDETIFGTKKNLTTRQWMEEAGLRLDFIFGKRVAEMVTAVTKPVIDGKEFKDRSDVKIAQPNQLKRASRKAVVLKMSDRLHNLRTLYFRSKEDQEKVARETLEIYLPIFREKSKKIKKIDAGQMLAEIEDLALQYLSDSPSIQIRGVWHGKLQEPNIMRRLI